MPLRYEADLLDGPYKATKDTFKIDQAVVPFRLNDDWALITRTREVVELFDPTAEDNNATLEFTGEGHADVIGDRDLLFEAVSNLVDNAIRHGGLKGLVSVAVSLRADGPVLSVADRGPGIPIEEREHVLRRFYRLEASRKSPGSGLGLSLVAAVANLHGARIEMADNAPGLRIELHFSHAASRIDMPVHTNNQRP